MVYKIGDRVTCKVPEDAYYSGYAGRPKVSFTPGMVGTVDAVRVPSVWRARVSFTCVDFEDETGRPQRVGLLDGNIRKIRDKGETNA